MTAMCQAMEDVEDTRDARAAVWQKQGNERHIDLAPRVIETLRSLPDRGGPVFQPRYSAGICK